MINELKLYRDITIVESRIFVFGAVDVNATKKRRERLHAKQSS